MGYLLPPLLLILETEQPLEEIAIVMYTDSRRYAAGKTVAQDNVRFKKCSFLRV